MIIVSGLHRKTGAVRTLNFVPGKEGNARTFRSHLRSLGYTTTFVNDVGERYAMQAEIRREAAERNRPFAYEGVSGYQLHSLGTARGNMKDSHVKASATDSLDAAIQNAQNKVDGWSDEHKGIVIYRAIKLVRSVARPTTEVIDLS